MNNNILIIGYRCSGKTTKICELLDKCKENYDDILIIAHDATMYNDKFSGRNNISIINNKIDDEFVIRYIKCNVNKKKLIISDDYMLDKHTINYLFCNSKNMNITYWNATQYGSLQNMKYYDVVIQTSYYDVYDKHKMQFLHKN